MVERDEDSRNGKRINGTDRKQQSPPTFVNQFARYMESKESKVSYAEVLRLGQTNKETLRLNHAHRDSGTNNTDVPSQSDGNLSRSYSTPSFDSSAPSTPSLPHSCSSPDLESQDSPTENKDCSSGHDFPNYSSPASTIRSNSDPSALSRSRIPLYFGKLKSSLSLPKSRPYQYSSTSTGPKNPSAPPPPPSTLSHSDSYKKELQHLIKRATESGTDPKATSNGKPPAPPPPPSPLWHSDSHAKELQRLIKSATESGKPSPPSSASSHSNSVTKELQRLIRRAMESGKPPPTT